jgi:hypothetical protein
MQTGTVTVEAGTTGDALERRQEVFRRWAPYFLLALGTFLAVVTAGLITPFNDQRTVAAVLVGAALVLELCWSSIGGRHQAPDRVSIGYYVLRWAIGFALTLLNGFFAFYAAAGYYDADERIPGPRTRRIALIACSIPVSAAQASGIPVQDSARWLVIA